MAGTRSTLKRDTVNTPVQAFCPDPTKSMAPINMANAGPVSLANTRIFNMNAGGDYDITGWLALNISPTATDCKIYFNGNTTFTKTVRHGQDNVIYVHERVTSITLTGTDTSVEIQGM